MAKPFDVIVMDAKSNWLQQRPHHYLALKNHTCEAIDEFDDLEKLGKGFTSVDPLEEVDIGDCIVPRLIFVNKNLQAHYKAKLICY